MSMRWGSCSRWSGLQWGRLGRRWGLWRGIGVIRSDSAGLVLIPRPGLAPAGDLLFFASPKKRRQKKGDPTVCDPCASLRGNLRCSGFAGFRRTRFAQTAASPDPRNPPLLGAYREAWKPNGPLLRSATKPPRRCAPRWLALSWAGGIRAAAV